MNVWRIGSKWGSKDILPVFKEHKICFCGEEAKVERLKNQVKKNDIVAITNGQLIVGIGIVDDIIPLMEISKPLSDEYADVPAIIFKDVFFSNSKPFGVYDGQGKEFHKTGDAYAKLIKNILLELQKQEKIQQKMQDKINLLEQKHQIIFTGAPGTGKTRLAKQIAEEMTKEDGESTLIQFHPAYSYEDFIRGIVAKTNEQGSISYEVENKILGNFAKKAQENSDKVYVLIIDEINRANLPAVLGELIYALEYRDKPVNSLYELDGSREIILPKNLYIIGTMNTADRSVGHIDYAIRRRFAFINIPPNEDVITDDKAKKLFTSIKEIFVNHLSPEFQQDDIMIGHSYFLSNSDIVDSDAYFNIRLEYEIKPLLREYVKDGILTCTIKTINDLKFNV